MKMTSLNARREELDKKELNLRGSLMKFNQFLIETDIKKQRAEKKANNERMEKESKVQEASEKMAERGLHVCNMYVCSTFTRHIAQMHYKVCFVLLMYLQRVPKVRVYL